MSTLQESRNDYAPTGDECRLGGSNVGLGAMNVGRRHARESMIVGENVFRVKDLTIQQHSGSLAAFWRTVQDMIMPLRTFFRATHNNFKRFNYLEEWHSYPSFLPEPSATDHKSMREMIENPKLGANFVVLMVVKLNGARQLQGSLTVYQAGHQEVRGDIIVHPKMDGDGRIYLFTS